MNTFLFVRFVSVLSVAGAVLAARTADAAAGDLYAVDIFQSTIFKYTPSAARSTFATGLQSPYIIAFDKAGNVYVGESDGSGSNRITKITAAGSKSAFVSAIYPLGMKFDLNGNLFVADKLTQSIVKVSPFGAKSTFAAVPNIADLAFDAAGNLYAADFGADGSAGDGHGAIYKFTPNGTKTTFASGLYRPRSLAFDFYGNLFVAADIGVCFGCTGPTSAIYKFKPDGTKSTFASGFYGFQGGLACDAAGNLFASAFSKTNLDLLKILPSGNANTFAASSRADGMAFEPPHGVPINLATRMQVLNGDNVVIAGFIITGSGGKQVIIRGLGPSLAAAGIQGALQDPILELHYPGGVTVNTNDNWKDTQASVIQASGLAPKDDRESAFSFNLPPGTYTVVMKGKNNGTGIGLIEIYDVDGSPACQLANISTRGHVGTGNDVLIGGFILGGNGARVLVRALGPSLTKAGIAGALSDPQLSLRNGNGVEIAFNDVWGLTYLVDDTNPDQIRATGIPPTDDAEAAIIATLPAGNYTAIVQGYNGATGVGLVEIYNLQ